jgi:hypothetical protein
MTLNEACFLISSAMLIPHISYGGYFILSRFKRFDPLVMLAGSGVAASLVVFLLNIFNPVIWFASLAVAFVFAILFHLKIRPQLTKVSLQEFCNYKIFIEAYGILLCLTGIFTVTFLPFMVPALGILNVIFVTRLNWLVFFRKRLYKLDFPNPEPLKNPLVSIIVIAYNEAKYISKTLESVASQTYGNYEVILVDDHSTDRTVEIAKAFGSMMPLKIVQKEIRGPSRSRNFGAANAKGEIILFLDADIILPPDFLEKALARFDRQSLSVAFFDFTPVTDSKIDLLYTVIYRFWLKITQYFNPRAIGSCLMVRKDLHDKLLFDESILISEDFDYVRRAVAYGRFRMLSQPVYRVSWRRFEVENRWLLILKYLAIELHRQHIGEIRKPLVSYEFGHYDKDCQ